jgi:hypothetical protein
MFQFRTSAADQSGSGPVGSFMMARKSVRTLGTSRCPRMKLSVAGAGDAALVSL